MICIVYNKKKEDKFVNEYIQTLVNFCKKAEHQHLIIDTYPVSENFFFKIKDPILFISIGGDGTALSALPLLIKYKTPLIPINFGSLGFISSVTAEQGLPLIEAFLQNKNQHFKIEERKIFSVSFGQKEYIAMNDIVINRGLSPKLINFDIYINQKIVTSIRADGVILSTATGSTAYNMACNGPILHPSIDGLIINSIAPHSLTFKPIVVPGKENIQIKINNIKKEYYAPLEIDGIVKERLSDNDSIICKMHTQKVNLIKDSSENYYSVLKEKLKWAL